MSINRPLSVRPELVEGLSFALIEEEGHGFDTLSPNGFGV
jgi:hypothetical protein